MKTVVITGGTGLLGMHLSILLTNHGYSVRHLSRKENLNAKFPAYYWNLETQEINQDVFKDIDSIIHLAGANLADSRWTPNRKKVLIDSRIKSTELLTSSIKNLEVSLSSFIACSAIGYYGSQGDSILNEKSPPGQDFMSEICIEWEKSLLGIKKQGIRCPIIRVGVVLSTLGGAFKELNAYHPLRVGAYFGDGAQYYSWIHIDDICNIFMSALTNENFQGIYNGTAPNPTTNKSLTKAIAKAHSKKMLNVPIPACTAKLMMGEMSSIVLNSTRAVPQALLDSEHNFKFPELIPAIKDLLKRKI